MIILPAIDLYECKAVRLYKGDYSQMTVYSKNPTEVAQGFEKSGAKYLHIVDLEGAKSGTTPNIGVVKEIKENTGLFVEIGGGIRSFDTIEKYLSLGVDRVILGTAAVTRKDFAKQAVERYGDRVAVGIDIRDGAVALKGWTEKSEYGYREFFGMMESIGVKNVICTDISRDGAMKGPNVGLYRELKRSFDIDVTASGGVSSYEDIAALAKENIYAAIVGKACYTGAVDVAKAIETAEECR